MNADDLVQRALEHANDTTDFRAVARSIQELSPADALLIWLKVLSKNSSLLLPRLELAKLLWQLECIPFALEQLQRIDQLNEGKSEAIRKLIERMGGRVGSESAKPADSGDGKTLASLDFDVDGLDNDS